jgi:hypothetical protein
VALLGKIPSAFAAQLPMDEKEFWQLIKVVKNEAGANVDSRPAVLQRNLSNLKSEEIQRFQMRYEALLLEANSWSLWGAASIMNGGCSDDGFKYFRDWLISEGDSAFREALLNPDSLASFARRDYFELELFGYAALRAFSAKGVGELERDFSVEYAVTKGREWAESELPGLFPRLAEKYVAK